jgi:hypothetical protein
VVTDAERKVSEAMMQMWTAFARIGNPSGLINWLAHDDSLDTFLYIGDPLQVKSGFSRVVEY